MRSCETTSEEGGVLLAHFCDRPDSRDTFLFEVLGQSNFATKVVVGLDEDVGEVHVIKMRGADEAVMRL